MPERLKATPHNAARAAGERIWVLMTELFRRNTLCIARKSSVIRAQIIRRMPQSYCAVLPQVIFKTNVKFSGARRCTRLSGLLSGLRVISFFSAPHAEFALAAVQNRQNF